MRCLLHEIGECSHPSKIAGPSPVSPTPRLVRPLQSAATTTNPANHDARKLQIRPLAWGNLRTPDPRQEQVVEETKTRIRRGGARAVDRHAHTVAPAARSVPGTASSRLCQIADVRRGDGLKLTCAAFDRFPPPGRKALDPSWGLCKPSSWDCTIAQDVGGGALGSVGSFSGS